MLACLALSGELAQNELAMQLRIEPSTLVRVLDRMERDGWIVRRPSPQDRRKNIIHPTEKVTAQMGDHRRVRRAHGAPGDDRTQRNAAGRAQRDARGDSGKSRN